MEEVVLGGKGNTQVRGEKQERRSQVMGNGKARRFTYILCKG